MASLQWRLEGLQPCEVIAVYMTQETRQGRRVVVLAAEEVYLHRVPD